MSTRSNCGNAESLDQDEFVVDEDFSRARAGVQKENAYSRVDARTGAGFPEGNPKPDSMITTAGDVANSSGLASANETMFPGDQLVSSDRR